MAEYGDAPCGQAAAVARVVVKELDDEEAMLTFEHRACVDALLEVGRAEALSGGVVLVRPAVDECAAQVGAPVECYGQHEGHVGGAGSVHDGDAVSGLDFDLGNGLLENSAVEIHDIVEVGLGRAG